MPLTADKRQVVDSAAVNVALMAESDNRSAAKIK